MRMYALGRTIEQIAKYFKVGRHTIGNHLKELGLPLRKCDGGRQGLYTSGELVDLFNGHISLTVIALWIRKGDLQTVGSSRRKARSIYYVTHDSLIAFLENSDYWCRWEGEWITDVDIREYAKTTRDCVTWRWIDLTQAGEQLLFHPRTILGWVEKGVLPAIRNGKKRWVRSDHIATIQSHFHLLPTSGDKQKVGRNRNKLIDQLRSLLVA